jgi:hypothetical protein
MKTLFKIFLVLVLLMPVVKAQELAPPVELYFITVNAPSSPIINCILSIQSQGWGDTSGTNSPGPYFLTNDYTNSVYTPDVNNMGTQSAGFDFITARTLVGGIPQYPIFTYGLYKVTSNETNKYFYLDYTDFRIGYYILYNPPSSGHNIDLWIKYDYNKDSLYYSSSGSGYYNIGNGQLLNFWDIKQKGTQLTSSFPDYWENCLAVVNDGDNHPRLVWGPYPDAGSLLGTITGYKIYRSANYNIGQPPGSFSLLETVDSDVFQYVDNTVTLGGGYSARSYFVTCVFEDIQEKVGETGSTDTVEVRLTIPWKRRSSNSSYQSNFEYKLQQNYPNPFNPATTIEFTLKENSVVSLRVFDILGREVAVIINDLLIAGNHQVVFDGHNLESGIYFYEIITDKFRDVKKLILLK